MVSCTGPGRLSGDSATAAVLPAGTSSVYPTTAADDAVGVRMHATDKVTGRLEYRHTDLGTFPSGGGKYTSNDILVGVGFKF